MSSTSHKINDNLWIVATEAPKAATAKPVEIPTNHIAVIDCSGSMGGDLPQIRNQFKTKLPKLLREGDTFSVVWFSGKGEFGTLLEAEQVNNLKDLSDVEKAIDRWLKPVGMTGFLEPFREVKQLTQRIAKKNQNPFSLFFLSDGCDNQWDRGQILKAVEEVSGSFVSATFVEYGYYADRNLLASMAEKSGGALIFSEDFERYDPVFADVLQKRPAGKRVEVKIEGDPIGGFAFALSDNSILTFDASGGKALVPESVTPVLYLSPVAVGQQGAPVGQQGTTGPVVAGAYAALSLYAVRMKSDVIFALLKSLGDIKFINQFTNCFGKQRYSEFMEAAKLAAFSPEDRRREGYNPDLVPAEDAFTVLDLLNLMAADKQNRILLDHPEFKYSRISRARVESDDNFSADEQKAIADITAKMSAEKNATKLKELQGELNALMAAKQAPLKFVAESTPDGYPVSALTFNEERPNVSLLVRKSGTVDLSSRLNTAPDEVKSKLKDSKFSSFIYRNYAIIKDGLVNVEHLPVKMTMESWAACMRAAPALQGLPSTVENNQVTTVLPLRKIPVINRKMMRQVSAKELFTLEYQLTKARAAQKVYNTYQKEKFGRKSEGFKLVYGSATADWLQALGITDYSGFGPKMVQAAASDVYMGKFMTVSLKGYSTLPSVKEVKEKMAKGKELTGCTALMAPYVQEVEQNLSDPAFESWLEDKLETAVTTVRELILQGAKIKFAIMVGQVWFPEFKSLDENTLTVTVEGKDLIGKVEMKEEEVKI